jgi:hypothetical protein
VPPRLVLRCGSSTSEVLGSLELPGPDTFVSTQFGMSGIGGANVEPLVGAMFVVVRCGACGAFDAGTTVSGGIARTTSYPESPDNRRAFVCFRKEEVRHV